MLCVDEPVWAWAAGVLLVAAVGLSFWQRGRSWRWRMAGIVLPLVSGACVALGMAGVAVGTRSEVVLYLDFSPSAERAAWRDPAWMQALARRHLAEDQRVRVVGFSGKQQHDLAETTAGGQWPLVWEWKPVAERMPSDPDFGLLFMGRKGEGRWVVTDGLVPAIPKEEGVVWTIVANREVDAGVREVKVRGIGEGKAEVVVELCGRGMRAGAKMRLRLLRDGKEVAREEMAAVAGVSRWQFVDGPVEEWPHMYEAEVMADGDRFAANDRGAVIWPGVGERRVLVVGEVPVQGLAVTFVKTGDFGKTASELAAEGWQAIVLNDVPAEAVEGRGALSPGAAQAVESFVRDNGGGLLMLSGTHAFGPGRYGEGTIAGDILERLSPLASHPVSGDLSVLFLLDASSSMGDAAGGTEKKMTLLSRAVQRAVRGLAADDRVTVVTFAGSANEVASGSVEEVGSRLAEILGRITPAGPTALDSAMPLVARFRAGTVNGRRLIVLVTDGEVPAVDVGRWVPLLSAGATCVLIAPPPPSAKGPLAQLAEATRAGWVKTEDPTAWVTALRGVVDGQTRGSVERTRLGWRAEGELSGEADVWTRTWGKGEARVLARGSGEVPVGAVVQRGLGKVAGLAVAEGGAGYAGLREKLLEEVLATAGDRRFVVRAERETGSGGWRVVVDGREGGTFLDGERLKIRPLVGRGEAVELKQTAPGRYEAAVPESRGLAGVVERGEGEGRQLVGRVVVEDVETGEWPASAEVAAAPEGVRVMSVEGGERWEPRGMMGLGMWCWVGGVVAAVGALWMRK